MVEWMDYIHPSVPLSINKQQTPLHTHPSPQKHKNNNDDDNNNKNKTSNTSNPPLTKQPQQPPKQKPYRSSPSQLQKQIAQPVC